MAFVNEYVSQEDIKKYKIENLIKKYRRYNNSPQVIRNFHWTIDMEKNIWLRLFGEEHDLEMDHASTRENIFILHYKGVNIECRVWLEEDSQNNIYISPFIVIWKYLSANPSSFANIDEIEIKEALKEALVTYGSAGIRSQFEEKNAIVKFRNFKKRNQKCP